MTNRKLNIGDIISFPNPNGGYVFVDLVVDHTLREGIYEVLDLLGNEGVYTIRYDESPYIEVT